MYKNKSIEIGNSTNSSTLIFLHGFGEEPLYYSRLSREITRFMPNMKIILPKARINTMSKNNTVKNKSWFDLTEFPITKNYYNNGLYIDYSIDLINKIIDKEIENGIPENKIFIGGFSQGGAMALVSALECKNINLGGIIIISGWIFKNQSLNGKLNSNIPIFIAHGRKDDIVFFENAIEIKSCLNKNNFNNITFKNYVNYGHKFPTGVWINNLIKWLNKFIT